MYVNFSQLRLSMEVILVAEDNSTFTKYRNKHSDKYNVVRDEHVLVNVELSSATSITSIDNLNWEK
jgi:hypothetical protein